MNATHLLPVLEQARHDLCTLHGLVVTDRPDLIEKTDIAWSIDNSQALAALDAAISALSGSDTPGS